MRYAIVDGQRREAARGLEGTCPGCGDPLQPRCGEVRVHHWAHRGTRHCDHWWENETDWHRAWKDAFPVDWQEVRQQAADGEWHIADVTSPYRGVLEFQHSAISPDERRSREHFYQRMAWVVDGHGRMRDLKAFECALKEGSLVSDQPIQYLVPIGGNLILGRWLESRVPVFFDFGMHDWGLLSRMAKEPILWRYSGVRGGSRACLAPVRRSRFLAHYKSADEPLKAMKFPAALSRPHQPAQGLRTLHPKQQRRSMTFEKYLHRKAARRRHARF